MSGYPAERFGYGTTFLVHARKPSGSRAGLAADGDRDLRGTFPIVLLTLDYLARRGAGRSLPYAASRGAHQKVLRFCDH